MTRLWRLKTPICLLARTYVLTKTEFLVKVYTEQFDSIELIYVNSIYMQVWIICLSLRAQ